MDITQILFTSSVISGVTIMLLCVVGLVSKKINFWPPPSSDSWQIKCFWVLFQFFALPFFAIIFLEFNRRTENPTIFSIGCILFSLGFILANIVSFNLGFKNSAGMSDGLKTSGWYSYSRNPVYVTTIIGLIGAVLALPIIEIFVISTIWTVCYVAAPFIEEPWLEKKYGKEYLAYKKKVGRFF